MKERMLVLAKASPVVSSKYHHLICVAGITEKGEWRRIYPVPFEIFLRGNGFRKKMWIEYDLVNDKPSDHRSESRKVHRDSVRELKEEKYTNIRKLLEERLTTLEELVDADPNKVSIGVIKPKLKKFYPSDHKHKEKLKDMSKQRTVSGKSVIKITIPDKAFNYSFRCGDSCPTVHKMMCEDWEITELYRHCEKYRKEGKYKDEKEVLKKVHQRAFDWLIKRPELYFIVGTHVRWNTYIIIGLVYPRKRDLVRKTIKKRVLKRLDSF